MLLVLSVAVELPVEVNEMLELAATNDRFASGEMFANELESKFSTKKEISETGELKMNACESPAFTQDVPRNNASLGKAMPTSQTPLPIFTPKNGDVDVVVAFHTIPLIVPVAVVLVALVAIPGTSAADA